ncbi:MAG: hypothetical protein R3B46_09240 [Phycisphaerales bacterium]|nr:hypothetical protein [Phycisphaerales bacterium]
MSRVAAGDISAFSSGQADAAPPEVVDAPVGARTQTDPGGDGDGRGPGTKRKKSFFERIEAWISRLSTRNNFWHRVCSMIWLPYAFQSGIRMKRVDGNTFTAVLPFKRVNKNWYNAMAGAALLANSEVAGGMYLFAEVGSDYTVVCKELSYKFLRPCLGPATYRVTPVEDVKALKADGGEFNITVDLDIFQSITKPMKREKRVGKCQATFHVTPKAHHKAKKRERGSA